MPKTSLQTPVFPIDLGPRRPQFQPILHDEDTNGISAADFQDVMMQQADVLHAVDEPDDLMLKNVEALRREIEILKLQHLEAEFEGADDETVPQFVQEIRDNDMLQGNGEDEEGINQHFTGVPVNHDYAPYGTKTMCCLDIVLNNLPRLQLSSSQFKMILWIMEACGAKDVPSFNAFRASRFERPPASRVNRISPTLETYC
ncbi:hypothetical protein C8R44DRAFT_736072 [Mycena epipterygia]|nr:hypothetical protein C8R44DRAFT_736072 [Mycena epipterygia]